MPVGTALTLGEALAYWAEHTQRHTERHTNTLVETLGGRSEQMEQLQKQRRMP